MQNKNQKDKLNALAKKTAKDIRKRVSIPGWTVNENCFPECDYEDVVAMLEKAYDMGKQDAKNI